MDQNYLFSTLFAVTNIYQFVSPNSKTAHRMSNQFGLQLIYITCPSLHPLSINKTIFKQQMSDTKVIQNYTLEQTLGTGTFGKVKLATHNITNQKVAVKVLQKARIDTKADLVRVQRELLILRKVRHPNIIQLYEILESETNIYLAMEYAKGGELFEFIVQNQKLSEERAATFLVQLLDAVEHLHHQGIVHRDLKPENLLLDENETIKVVDFGLSNTYKPGQLLKTACGSPCYAAPEMLHGLPYDGMLTDIWSCGVILYAMVCGFLPFEDANTNALYEKIKNDQFEIPSHLSPAAISLLKGMLCKDPTTRYSFDRIRGHSFTRRARIHKLSIQKDLDHSILNEMEVLGFKNNDVIEMLAKNKHNSATATYYLLQVKKSKQVQPIGMQKVLDLFNRRKGCVVKRVGTSKVRTEANPPPDESQPFRIHQQVSSTGGSSSKDKLIPKRKPDGAMKSLQSTIPKKRNNFFEQDQREIHAITNSINIRGVSHPVKHPAISPDRMVGRPPPAYKPIPSKKMLEIEQMLRGNSLEARSSLHSVNQPAALNSSKNGLRQKQPSMYNSRYARTQKTEVTQDQDGSNYQQIRGIVRQQQIAKSYQIRQRSVGHEQQRLMIQLQKKCLDDSSFTNQLDMSQNINPYLRSVGPLSPAHNNQSFTFKEQINEKLMRMQRNTRDSKRKIGRITNLSKQHQNVPYEYLPKQF